MESESHADNQSPALFAGYKTTPVHAVENFVNLSLDYGFMFSLL
jgi:tRNA-dihydrouridine synthase 4